MGSNQYNELQVQTFRHLTEQEFHAIQKNAERGDYNALLKRGMCSLYGQVSPIDFSEAYNSFKRIALEDALASCYCGYIEENGLGMSPDYISAIEHYAHAAGCCEKIFQSESSYTKIASQFSKTVSAAQRCRSQFFQFVSSLGLCIHERKDFSDILANCCGAEDVLITSNRIDFLARIALLQKNKHCMNLLGLIYEYNEEFFDLDCAEKWYELAITHGSKEANKNLNHLKGTEAYHILKSRNISSNGEEQLNINSVEFQIILAENGHIQSIDNLMRSESYSNIELDRMLSCLNIVPFYERIVSKGNKDYCLNWKTLVSQEIQRIKKLDTEQKHRKEEERQRQIVLRKAEKEKRRQEAQERLKAEQDAKEKRKQEEQARIKAKREAEEKRRQEEQARLKAEREAEEKRKQQEMQQQKDEEERIRKEKEKARKKEEYEALREPIEVESKRWEMRMIVAGGCYIVLMLALLVDEEISLFNAVVLVLGTILSVFLPIACFLCMRKNAHYENCLDVLSKEYSEYLDEENMKNASQSDTYQSENRRFAKQYELLSKRMKRFEKCFNIGMTGVLISFILEFTCAWAYSTLIKLEYETSLIINFSKLLGCFIVCGGISAYLAMKKGNNIEEEIQRLKEM